MAGVTSDLPGDSGIGFGASCSVKFFPYTVRHAVFFYVETDFRFRRLWGRLKQRAQLLKDVPQCEVMQKQSFVNFSKAFENRGVRREFLAYFDERADDVKAHGDRAGAVENSGSHERAVLCRSVRAMSPASTSFWSSNLEY